MVELGYPRARILLTNDDGADSPGLRLLYEAVHDLGEVKIIVPEASRSACGHGMTLHKPIKARRVTLWGNIDALVIDGLPADAVYIALSESKPSIVLSGINMGDNTSLQSILASATIGAIMHAALNDVPGIAFSADTRSMEDFELLVKSHGIFIKKIIRGLASLVLNKELPHQVKALSVNFPRSIRTREIAIAKPAKLRFKQLAKPVKSTNNETYYRIIGTPVSTQGDNDVAMLLEGKVVITPICIESLFFCGTDLYIHLAKLIRDRVLSTSQVFN